MTARKKDKEPAAQIVKIWKAPEWAEANYVTVTGSGEMLQAWRTLAEIRAYYDHAIKAGTVTLQRELNKTYRPKGQ